jgi:hypothetical protein
MLSAKNAARRFLWNLWPWSRWKVVYVEDAPDVPQVGRVYVLGGREHPFQA